MFAFFVPIAQKYIKVNYCVHKKNYPSSCKIYLCHAEITSGTMKISPAGFLTIPSLAAAAGSKSGQKKSRNLESSGKKSKSEKGGIVYGLQPDCSVNDPYNFNICLDLVSLSGDYELWMDAFEDAKNRWSQVIVKDPISPPIASVTDLYPSPIATEAPTNVDDIYIAGFEDNIDGPRGVLGYASPTWGVWIGLNFFLFSGYMVFDSPDIQWMIDTDIWTDVILHEMGHVLGIGSIWSTVGLHSGSLTDDRYFGGAAQAAWRNLGCSGPLPVEDNKLPGKAGVHWDDICLGNELMTGYIGDTVSSPLSTITIAGLMDLGYTVDFSAADDYGLENLGDCGDYCPEAADLVIRRKLNKSPDGLSDEGRETAIMAGSQQLLKKRLEAPSDETDFPPSMVYVAGEFVTVYLEENGQVFGVSVTREEAEQYTNRN